MTPQQIEAMKLALEALEYLGTMHFQHTGEALYQETFTALEEALAEHAMQEVQRLGQEIEDEPVAWLLTDKKINELQVDAIQRLINRLNHAHHTDLCVRINGQDEWFEADWLKHMVRVNPPQPVQEPVAHWSDCSVHSEPAYSKGECDCGGIVAVADYTALSDKYVALSDKYVALSDKYVALKARRTEQEPVAWMDADGNVSDNNDHKCFPIPLYTKEQP